MKGFFLFFFFVRGSPRVQKTDMGPCGLVLVEVSGCAFFFPPHIGKCPRSVSIANMVKGGKGGGGKGKG